jgi:hypothetical protein
MLEKPLRHFSRDARTQHRTLHEQIISLRQTAGGGEARAGWRRTSEHDELTKTIPKRHSSVCLQDAQPATASWRGRRRAPKVATRSQSVCRLGRTTGRAAGGALDGGQASEGPSSRSASPEPGEHRGTGPRPPAPDSDSEDEAERARSAFFSDSVNLGHAHRIRRL